MKPVRIIQLSDCHLSAQADVPYRGINARLNLESLLDSICNWRPDLLLLTGDLAEDGSEAAYRYLAGVICDLEIPYLALPGNHDVPALQRKMLASSADGMAVFEDLLDWRIIMLDSTSDGVPGHLPERRLEQLQYLLANHNGPKLVALHHQPVLVGSPWIDKYPLLEPESFWRVIDRHSQVRVVTWGHVHQGFEDLRGGTHLYSAPSSAINGAPGQEKFVPDERGPGVRWFELGRGGAVRSGVLFAQPELDQERQHQSQ